MSLARNIQKITAGFFFIGLTGTGTYFVYLFLRDFDKVETDDYKPKIPNVKNEFDFKLNEDYSVTPYLGEDGLKLLTERIKNDLGYGPEINGLQSINLVEGKYISDDNNGVFIEETKQIFINTKNMRIIAGDTENLAKKVEAVFQVVSHEYGHYISSRYLKNHKLSENVSDLYSGDAESRHQTTWDKYFVDDFKRVLGYDKQTPFYPQKTVTDEGKTYNLIPSFYTPFDLFTGANSKDAPLNKNMENAIMSGKYLVTKPHITDNKTLSYLYSIDELYTRKYMQMDFILKNDKHVWSRDGLGWMEVIRGGHRRSLSTLFVTDTLRYQPSIHLPVRQDPDWRFYNDSPYGIDENGLNDPTGASQLNELMLTEMGQKNGADISVIFEDNRLKMSSKNQIAPISHDSTSWVDDNKIKFGGYISNDKISHVGYYDSNNKFVSFEIKKHNTTYGYKEEITDQNRILPTGETIFYTTKNYINGNDITNHQLYFAEDSNGLNAVKMVSTRDAIVGSTSNYYQDHYRTFNRIFKAIPQKDGLILQSSRI